MSGKRRMNIEVETRRWSPRDQILNSKVYAKFGLPNINVQRREKVPLRYSGLHSSTEPYKIPHMLKSTWFFKIKGSKDYFIKQIFGGEGLFH